MASGPYRRLRGLLTCIMLLALAPVVAAQSITDARRVEFTPSADHNAVDPTSGVALVTKYTLDVYVAGGATPVSNADLGKPAPQSDGMIRVDFVTLLTTALTPGIVYESVVKAVGPVRCVWSASRRPGSRSAGSSDSSTTYAHRDSTRRSMRCARGSATNPSIARARASASGVASRTGGRRKRHEMSTACG